MIPSKKLLAWSKTQFLDRIVPENITALAVRNAFNKYWQERRTWYNTGDGPNENIDSTGVPQSFTLDHYCETSSKMMYLILRFMEDAISIGCADDIMCCF